VHLYEGIMCARVSCCLRPERHNMTDREVHAELEKISASDLGQKVIADHRAGLLRKVHLLDQYTRLDQEGLR
jgi:hypothetical protein